MLKGDETTIEVQAPIDDKRTTDADMALFFNSPSLCGTKPAMLSLTSEYSNTYIPRITFPTFP